MTPRNGNNADADRLAMEASDILRQIAELKNAIDHIIADATAKKIELRKELTDRCKPLQERIARLEKQLDAPAVQLQTVKPFRSKKLPFGELVNSQGKPRLVYIAEDLDEELVARRLIKCGFTDCVRTKYSINREVLRLKRLPEKTLHNLGIEFQGGGRLRYRIPRESLPSAGDSMEIRDTD